MALHPDRQRGRGDGYDLSQQLQVFTSDCASFLMLCGVCVCVCVWKILDVYCVYILFLFAYYFFFLCVSLQASARERVIPDDTCTYLYIYFPVLNSADLSEPFLPVSMAKRNLCVFTCFH